MKHKTRTKVLSLLLSLVMVLSLVPSLGLTAYADATYSGGTGTEADPYLISTVDDWKALAAAVNSGTEYSGKYFKQTANLDMSGVEGLAPVGTMDACFAGNYNGSGFEISNATINVVVTSGNAVAGVFGVLTGGGSISNLKVKSAAITATTGNGGFDSAYAGGLVALAENATIIGCSVSNSTITASGNDTFTGAFVGFAGAENSEKTAFSKCASENNTVNTMEYGGGFIGAIVNETGSDDAISFTDCYSAKNSADAGAHTYGTVGAFLGGSQGGNVTAQNCFVYDCNATATGTGSFKGVFTADTTYGTVKATNCYYYDTHELTVNAESATSKTADDMKSLASTLGDSFADGDLYPVLAHKHSFTYTAEGATITATCSEAGCDLTDSKVTLTITDPVNTHYDDKTSSHEFTLEGLEAFNSATGKTISASDIVYYKGDNQSSDIKNNTVKGATYKARLTVEGKRAEHSFRFIALHSHSFTYTVDGNVITATCTQNAANMDACDLTDKKATLTLNAPAHQTYGDGLEANATLTGEIPGVTNPTINYRKSDTPLGSAPTDAGSYTAWCQLGTVTARVNYTIAQATASYSTEPTAKTGLVYTGEERELVNDGVVNGGDIAYTVGTDPNNEPDVTAGGMPYSFEIPKMDDAGTYYVWYKLEGGKNYTSIAAKKIEVKIAKANITPSVSLEGWTYGEDAKTPSVDGNTGSGTVTYTYKVKDADDSTYSATVPTNAGDYTVKATVAESDNYNGGEATKNFTIAKKAATITADAKSKTYGDADPELTATVEGTVGSDTLSYTLNRTEGNNFGEYDITVTLGENPNYDITTTGAKFTINKKAVTIKAKDQSIYVGGNVPTLEGADFYTVTGLVGEDTLTTAPTLNYQKDGNAASPVNTTAGTYDIVPSSAAAGDNYEITYQNGTLTISRRPSSGGGTPTATTVTVPVSGDDETVNVKVEVKGDTATITSADVDKVLEAEEVGTVTVDVSALKENVNEVVIPNEMLEKVADAVADEENTADGLEVKLPAGSVAFDADALATITEQADGKDLTLHLDDVKVTELTSAQQEGVSDLEIEVVLDAYLTSGGKRISDFNGGSATVKIPYTLKEGQTAQGIVVWYVAADGTRSQVPASYDGKNVVFTVPHFSNYVIAYDAEKAAACPKDDTCPISAFTDADPTAWYHDGVHFVLANGIMNGMGDGKFAPNDNTSRAMIVTILYRLEGEPAVTGENPFTDVADGQWYTNAVIWAAENDIVGGYGNGKFGPNDPITREQLATILYRYAQSKGQGFTGAWMFLLDYPDASEISIWADEAMHWCVMNGIINGKDGKLVPKGDASRAEAATMLQRFCEVTK